MVLYVASAKVHKLISTAHPYLASYIASIGVQSANKLEHDTHAIFWSRVKHLHLRMVEREAWVSHCVPSLPQADCDKGISSCR